MRAATVRRRRPAENPFASHRIDGLTYRCRGRGVGELCRRLERLGGRAAIVGPKGSGKTTLLEELAETLPGNVVHIRISGGCERPWYSVRAQLPEPVIPSDSILVDGAEQLDTLKWRRLIHVTRSAGRLVTTLHRPGPLPTLIECRTDRALLRELVAELAPAEARLLEPNLDGIFERHHGNIRSCLRELYDVYAGRISFEC
jgi:hypothetical protein